MPVLAIGGAASYGDHVGDAMKLVADDVQSVVIPGAGHWVAEEAPDEMLAALTRVPDHRAPRRTRLSSTPAGQSRPFEVDGGPWNQGPPSPSLALVEGSACWLLVGTT